jgi:hypothetical protein
VGNSWYKERNKQTKKAFKKIKRALANALTLGLPVVISPSSYMYMRDWEL